MIARGKCIVFLIFFSNLFSIRCIGQDTTIYTLLTYGLPNISFNSARNIVQKKWSIKYEVVGGCVVDEAMFAKVEKHNDSVNNLLELKYGKDWYDLFLEEIDQEIKNQDKLKELIYANELVLTKAKALAKDMNRLSFHFLKINENEYKIDLNGYELSKGDTKWVRYFRIQAFLTEEKIIILEKRE